MRTAFIETLLELARVDNRIMLLTGDLGFGVVVPFMEELPNQFVNVGIAEQNMIGLATGLALSGKTVFVYSIGNFPTLRCLEQIRNDVCSHQANVTIVTVGGGLAYGSLGMTHHATEDLAIMRALPDMLVVAPGDPLETRSATRFSADYNGPVYLRLGRAGEPVVHAEEPDFQPGQALLVRQGHDVALLVTGGMLHTTVQAALALEAEGISTRVISMPTVKPLDTALVVDTARSTSALFTIEEHSIIGGLGSAVAETLLEAGVSPPAFRRIGLKGSFSGLVGDQDYLRAQHGLDTAGILQTVRSVVDCA